MVVGFFMDNETAIVAKTDLPEVKQVGRKFLVPIYSTSKKTEIVDGKEVVKPHSEIISLSPRQHYVVTSFAKCWCYEQTAKECGIKISSVKRILRHRDVRRYIEEVRHRAGAVLDTDIPWLVNRLRKAADGESNLNETQRFALKEILKLLSPKSPSVAVQVNSFYDSRRYENEGDLKNAWAKRKDAAA